MTTIKNLSLFAVFSLLTIAFIAVVASAGFYIAALAGGDEVIGFIAGGITGAAIVIVLSVLNLPRETQE